MIGLLESLDRLAAVEQGIPKVQAAHVGAPAGQTGGLKVPCFMNYFTLETTVRRANEQREDRYTVTVQLFAARATGNVPKAVRTAIELHDAFLDACDRALQLGDAWVFSPAVRSKNGEDQPVILKWNRLNYVGAEYEMDLRLVKSTEFAA